jgi:hypothetical protein
MPASGQQSRSRDLRPQEQSAESVPDKAQQRFSRDRGGVASSDVDSSAGRELGIDSSASYGTFGSGLEVQHSSGSSIGASTGGKSATSDRKWTMLFVLCGKTCIFC